MTDRVHVLSCRFTKREALIIERLAKRQGTLVANYVRGAVMTAAVMDGDLEAMKLLGGYVMKMVAEKGARMIREERVKVEAA
jgi:hypothetical protein